MTPAEHAARIHKCLPLVGPLADESRASVAALRAQAERATEPYAPDPEEWAEYEALAQKFREAEARATELERERDEAQRKCDEWKGITTEWRERAEQLERELASATIACNVAVTQAERAENALREIAEDRGPLGESFTGTYQMRDFARAALGETASLVSDAMRQATTPPDVKANGSENGLTGRQHHVS